MFDIPADLDTPVSAFLKLKPLRPRFLLESVEGGERVARYSFIGFGEADEVVLHDDDDPLDRLRKALAEAPAFEPGAPFPGGLVGFTGYDVVRRFESLPAGPARGDGPLAAYLAPRSVLVFDHVTRRAGVLHAGSEAEARAVRSDVVRRLAGAVPPVGQGRASAPVPTLGRAPFVERVARVKEHILAGDVFQLVLSTAFTGETDLPPFEVYRALRQTNPSPYLYYVDVGGQQIIGSSPEALVKLDGRAATLRPIAGTRPRGATTTEDEALEAELLADPKEAAEHVMLVDLARNDLGRVAEPGTIEVTPYRTIERYSHVMHIVSGVQGRVEEGFDAFDLFAATFPAGTVVGAPKVRAMEIIDELEPERRGVYAGTVGYFGHGGAMDQAIAIRTLTLRDGAYRYQAGAGIVADSDPDAEYAEVCAKGAALATALRLAEEAACIASS
ncbi:MAG: anthranilate synthase component I family protein [Bacteroidota bacterium]